MKPQFFPNQLDFRLWLEENHATAAELLVGFYKVGSGKPSMTWPESVDQALCFGWIDGIRRSVDHESYSIRFTPRRRNSIWSAVNIEKVAELTRNDLMMPPGIAAFELRTENKSGIYAYENEVRQFPIELEKIFRLNEPAWSFFDAQPAGYKRIMLHWVLSGKKEETRISRLNKLITASEAKTRLR